jgi:hypothetical protein
MDTRAEKDGLTRVGDVLAGNVGSDVSTTGLEQATKSE